MMTDTNCVVVGVIDENEELHKIDETYYIFNKKENTYQPATVADHVSENINPSTKNVSPPKTEKFEEKKWTSDATLMLIDLHQENEENFKKYVRKHIWLKIANTINSNLDLNFTWQQVDTKWKGLMKTYKEIKDHNNTSGQRRCHWEYYEKMNNIMAKKPEIEPVATCSSSSGLVLQPTKSNCQQELATTRINHQEEAASSSFSKKRKAATVAVERRHKEKMERQDRFLEYFDEFIKILRNKESVK